MKNMVTRLERYKIIRDAPNIDSFNYVMTTITRYKSDPTITTRVMEWLRLMEGQVKPIKQRQQLVVVATTALLPQVLEQQSDDRGTFKKQILYYRHVGRTVR